LNRTPTLVTLPSAPFVLVLPAIRCLHNDMYKDEPLRGTFPVTDHLQVVGEAIIDDSSLHRIGVASDPLPRSFLEIWYRTCMNPYMFFLNLLSRHWYTWVVRHWVVACLVPVSQLLSSLLANLLVGCFHITDSLPDTLDVIVKRRLVG
jgi:hypothetical protein